MGRNSPFTKAATKRRSPGSDQQHFFGHCKPCEAVSTQPWLARSFAALINNILILHRKSLQLLSIYLPSVLCVSFMDLECSQWHCNEVNAVTVIGFTLPGERVGFQKKKDNFTFCYQPDASQSCAWKASAPTSFADRHIHCVLPVNRKSNPQLNALSRCVQKSLHPLVKHNHLKWSEMAFLIASRDRISKCSHRGRGDEWAAITPRENELGLKANRAAECFSDWKQQSVPITGQEWMMENRQKRADAEAVGSSSTAGAGSAQAAPLGGTKAPACTQQLSPALTQGLCIPIQSVTFLCSKVAVSL